MEARELLEKLSIEDIKQIMTYMVAHIPMIDKVM